jgi:branched-chain amino acid transport system permease protein
MVSLAIAQTALIIITTMAFNVFGGDDGLSLDASGVPSALTGVVNRDNLYLLALAFALVTWIICKLAVSSRMGHFWVAIRENEPRVRLLGVNPYWYKLASFTLSATLAGAGGGIFVLIIGGADTSIIAPQFGLLILVMVVVGGAGRIWGAAIGGFAFGVADFRLTSLGSQGSIRGLPGWIGHPLSQPEFILGVLYIVIMLFEPGGLSSIFERVGGLLGRLRGRRRVVETAGSSAV